MQLQAVKVSIQVLPDHAIDSSAHFADIALVDSQPSNHEVLISVLKVAALVYVEQDHAGVLGKRKATRAARRGPR